jgi:hypothetical protein
MACGRREASDSDLRLQVLMRVHQGVTPGGMATVSETVSKPVSVRTIRYYLPVFAETRQNSHSQTRMKPDWFLDSEKSVMKTRFILFRRAGVFYSEDTTTGEQHSLRTEDEAEALTLLHSKNEAHRQPVLNLQIARTYLTATDPRSGESDLADANG